MSQYCVFCIAEQATHRLKTCKVVAVCSASSCRTRANAVIMINAEQEIVLTDFPPEILLSILMNLQDDIGSLRSVAETNSYLFQLVSRSPEFWRLIDVTYLTSQQRQAYKEYPMLYVATVFRVQYRRSLEEIPRRKPETRAAIKEHKQLALIHSIREFMEAGHLGLAQYTNALRDRDAFLDEYLSDELLRGIFNIVNESSGDEIRSMLPVIPWALSIAKQERFGFVVDERVWASSLEDYIGAIAIALWTADLDIAETLLNGLVDPSMQLTSTVFVTTPHDVAKPLIKWRKYSAVLLQYFPWTDLLNQIVEEIEELSPEQEKAMAKLLFRYLPLPRDEDDWHPRVVIAITQMIEKRRWVMLSELLRREEILPRHFDFEQREIIELQAPAEVRQLFQQVLTR